MDDDELTPEQKFHAEDGETLTWRALLLGRAAEDVVADLVRLDWSPRAARALVQRVAEDLRRWRESPESRRALVAEARRQMVAGLLIALLGAGVSALTLLAALSGALPFYVVAGGAVLVGLILARRGWARWSLFRRDRLPYEDL